MATIVERLLRRRKIDVETGCWIWTGSRDACGYGTIWDSEKRKVVGVHRAAYLAMIGEVPNGLEVCHRCDVPNCFCPDHLFIGTHDDNMKDMVRKGRQAVGDVLRGPKCHGEKHCRAKLTESDVKEIRRRYAKQEVSQVKLAREFGVTAPVIGYVVRRVTWKHVT